MCSQPPTPSVWLLLRGRSVPAPSLYLLFFGTSLAEPSSLHQQATAPRASARTLVASRKHKAALLCQGRYRARQDSRFRKQVSSEHDTTAHCHPRFACFLAPKHSQAAYFIISVEDKPPVWGRRLAAPRLLHPSLCVFIRVQGLIQDEHTRS